MRQRGNSVSIDPWIRVGLVLAATAPFVGTLFYGFVYDDRAIILHNPVIQGWRSLVEVWKNPYWVNGGPDTTGLYRPVLMALFAVIWNGAHKFAIAFHLVAVMLHAAATLLLATLLRRGVGRWPAAGAALWFAVHPVHVEAVANISNVSEVLVCVWTILLTLWLLPAGEMPPERWLPPGWARSTVAAALYAAALLTKESGGVAPALALLAVIAWGQPSNSSAVRGTLARSRGWHRVIALWGAALAGVLIVRRLVLGGVVGKVSMAVPGLYGIGASQRVWAMLSTGGHVARLLLWPTTQSPDYGPSILPPAPGPSPSAVLTIVTIVTAIVWACWLAWRPRDPDARPLAGIGWCLIGYFPASNLLAATGPILGERTLYVSSVGVAMLLAWGLDRAAVSVAVSVAAPRRARPGRIGWVATTVVAATLLAACARGYVHTRDYARVWRDHPTLFAQIVRADSLDYRGYQLLAIEAKNHHRDADAAALYSRAYALAPSNVYLLTDYGEYLLEMHRDRHALAIGQRLLAHPDMRTDQRAVTLFLNAMGRVWGVDSVLAAARRLNAQAPSARAALFIGMAYEVRGDSAAARAAYRAGLRVAPDDSALAAHATAMATP